MADEKGEKSTEDLVAEARNFFNYYRKEIGKSIRSGNKIIFIDFDDIASFSHTLSETLMTSPEEVFQVMEVALEESGLVENPRVRLSAIPDSQEIRVRNIRAQHLNHLISIEGIVRQASDVRPQVVNAKFECPACGTIISVLQIDKKFQEPSRCSCGRKGQFRLVSKQMVDAQRIVIEESPESLIGGEQPKRVAVFLKEDLVDPKMEDRATPGSRVRIIGILKEVPVPLPTGALSTRFDIAIEANNIIPMEESFDEFDISEEDERQILELAADKNLFKKIIGSIAPSIYGYEEIKQTLALQLFGGVKKKRADGTDTRGDIHVLLVGDPGVAKSTSKDAKIMCISKKEAEYETIENIYKKFKRFPKNLKVLTIDTKKHEPKWEKVSEIIKHKPEKRLIRITTEHGKQITATEDHSFITLSKKGEIIPVKGNELTKGSYLPLPINFHKEMLKELRAERFNTRATNSKLLPEKIELDKNFGFFIGIFLAEGYLRNKEAVVISNKNKGIQERVTLFSKSMKLNYNSDGKSVSIFSKNLCDLLAAYCYSQQDLPNVKKGTKGNYSRIKKLPDFAYFAPIGFIRGLISGIFSGDGRLIKDKNMLKGFELITVSKSLAEGTSDLLFSIGILNKLKQREYTYKGNKTNYYSLAVPTATIKKFTENIEILGREIRYNENEPIYSYNNLLPCGKLVYEVTKKLGYNSRIFGNRTLAAEMRTVKNRNEIGRIRLLKLIKEFESKAKGKLPELEILKKIAESNLVWSKIKEVEQLKKRNEDVYDLSIPSTNTFVANGIGVHNSVALKFMASIAPKGRYVVGKSTSGAGITASVVKDEFMRGWALEAGAMVLSNKGMICIDEIDKMSPEDRSAMHESLEQQTVTITKANIQATLKAETSVLAAANPKLGRFEPFQVIAQQIDMPPTLLNRFDVIFTLRDLPDRGKDEAIATHVLLEHKREGKKQMIEKELLRKYIAYAKQRFQPLLTEEAIKEIKDFYVNLRNAPTGMPEGVVKPIPISARQLDALIRLSEAAAKLQLKKKVTREDAKLAISILKYYLMQVGFDQETKTFDIDRIATGVSTSQRSKIIVVREAIARLEGRMGKLIPVEELQKELEEKITKEEIEDSIQKLKQTGDIFEPRKGYVQRV